MRAARRGTKRAQRAPTTSRREGVILKIRGYQQGGYEMKHIEAWRLRDEAYRGVLSSWARGWKALVAHLWAAVGGTSPRLHNMNNK